MINEPLCLKKYKAEFILKYKTYNNNINNKLNIKLYDIIIPNNNKKYQNNHKKTDDKWVKGISQVGLGLSSCSSGSVDNEIEVLKPGPNAWCRDNIKDDSKLIIGILNKLTLDNFDKMIEETSILNYNNEKIIDIIFTKSVSEKDFSSLYADYCKRLNLDKLINELCLEQFNMKKNKNLCKFIGSLYKINLIKSIDPFINFLTNNLDSNNLEMLLIIIKTAGADKSEFKEILNNLNNIKSTFNTRLKFAIMDIIDIS